MTGVTKTIRRQDRDQVLRATLEALFSNLWCGASIPHADGALALRAWFDAGAKYMNEITLPPYSAATAGPDSGARSALLKALDEMRTLSEKRLGGEAAFSKRDLMVALAQTKHAFLECDVAVTSGHSIPEVWGTHLADSQRDILPHVVFDQMCWHALQKFFHSPASDRPFLEMFCGAASELRTEILVAEMGS